MALRTTGHLLLGIVRIYSRKAKYLLADCNEAFLKIKMAFRPGQVDLPEEGREAQLNAITLPEVFHDFDSALPDFNEFEYQQQLSLNQSRIDDITMKEDLPTRSGLADFGLAAGMDDFGDHIGDLDEFDALEQLRDGSTSMGSMRRSRVEGSRLSEALADGTRMDIDAPIPDDFGTDIDDHLFMDEIFNDEVMREAEANVVEGLREHEDEAKAHEETLLAHNAEESFALEPLDATVMQGLERHKTRKKRKLVVDDSKNITGDEMKSQMNNYEDTLVQIDLAPPTKKLMQFKETGTAEKFFFSPAMTNCFMSKRLLKQFTAHLIAKCKEEDKQAKAELLDELELAKNGELIEELENPALALEEGRLSAIPEEPGSHLIPGMEHQLPVPDQIQEEERVPSVSPIPAQSDKSESPVPAAPQKEKEKEKKRERKSRPSQEHSRSTLDDDEEEEPEEKRWTKRTHHVLEMLRKKLKEQKEVTFSEISKAATRKSAAQKFYTLLALKKWQAIKFEQEEPYGEIVIKKGSQLYKVDA